MADDSSPAQRAWHASVRAAGVGFDWPDLAAVRDKLREEVGELERALDRPEEPAAVEEEVGDVLFTLVNVLRFVPGQGESSLDRALAAACSRFEARFARVAAALEADGSDWSEAPQSLERRWRAAKERPAC